MTPKIFSTLRFIWLVLLLFAVVFTVKKADVQFDLLGLLPDSKTEKMLHVKSFMDEANFSKQVVILLGHKDQKTAHDSLKKLQNFIKEKELPLQESDIQKTQSDLKAFFQKLYPHKDYLLSQNDRILLQQDQGNTIAERALKEITSPFSNFGSANLTEDPFFLFPRYALSLTPQTAFKTDSKTGAPYIEENGKFWYVYHGHLTQDTFSLKLQESLSNTLTPFLETLSADILKTGGIFYAAAGSQNAQQEISRIGGVSALLIILLLLFIFRSLAPLNFALLIITSGLVGGASFTFLIHGSLHILALVFGASLIGVCVDYALHYYCAHLHVKKTTNLSALKSLMPALPLGVLSSCLGYGLLTFVPFPGIQQMALLASSGLFSAFITVALWGPVLLKTQPKTPPQYALKIQSILEKIASTPLPKKTITLLIIAFSTISFFNITFDDNVRNFQSLDQDLKSQEKEIKEKMSLSTSPSFFVVSAQNLEELLQLEEQITDELYALNINHQSLSRIIPSKKRQLENKGLIETKLMTPFRDNFLKTLSASPLKAPESNASLLKEIPNLPENWRLLFSKENDIFQGRILINMAHPIQDLHEIAQKYKGVFYIDPPQEYSSLFTHYRLLLMKMLAVVLGIIILILTLIKGIRSAAKINLPVILSLALTVSILSLSGVELTLFHVMGLLLVLCIGIDYALFLYWRHHTTQGKDFFLLANAMAAMTTLFSFGTLSLSSTTAVQGFGLSVFVGISLSFLMTTLYLGKK